jgi:hypothetical protein
MKLIRLKYKYMIKKKILFIMALISSFIIGCSSDSNESTYFSNDNAIVSFSLKVGSQWTPIKVYSDSLVFNAPKGFLFNDVQANYALTDRSTISPDPATITDWSSDINFELTAPDGKTKRTYVYKVNAEGTASAISGFYSLNSQEEVNAFASKNLTKVLALSINGTTENPITDLSPLNSLVEIEYQLNINNFQAKELNGLVNLKKVANLNVAGDELEVLRLDALEQVNNLSVGYFGTSKEVSKAPKLKEIYWNKLAVIHNSLILHTLSLDTFAGFTSLKSIGGEAIIRSASTTFSGLDNLESVYNLTIVNPFATSLEGLGSLTTVTREFHLSYMNSITTLDGSNLKYLKNLNINNCTKLLDITALKNIEALDFLFISGVPSLSSLEGLHNLKRIQNSLSLLYLGKSASIGIKDLNGLRSLEGVGKSIDIRGCYALTDYCDVSNMLASFKGTWFVSSNGYNPTFEQVQTACKK